MISSLGSLAKGACAPRAAMALILATAACTLDAPCPDMQFARLRATNRVVITTYMNETLRTIADQASIAALVAFAEAHDRECFNTRHPTIEPR